MKLLAWGFPLGFLATGALIIRPAWRISEATTLRPVVDYRFNEPFPVLVFSADTPWVNMVEDPQSIPPPPAGSSYLIPEEQVDKVQQYIREHDPLRSRSTWVLRVRTLSAQRQRIELFRMADGYWGGVYDATSTSITPRFRKITGPAYGLMFAILAFTMNAILWGFIIAAYWLFRRARHAAQQAH